MIADADKKSKTGEASSSALLIALTVGIIQVPPPPFSPLRAAIPPQQGVRIRHLAVMCSFGKDLGW